MRFNNEIIMAKRYTYTGSLPVQLKNAVEVYAIRHKISIDKVIETALKKFLLEKRKNNYIKTFIKANNNSEMISMADWGLKDYLNQLKQLEKGDHQSGSWEGFSNSFDEKEWTW